MRSFQRFSVAPLLSCLVVCAACASDAGGDDTKLEPVALGKGPIVADWANGSLSYVNAAALAAGAATRDALVTKTVDLSMYPPGPIDLAVTPDKRSLLVSSSAGFFSIPGSGLLLGLSDVPTGAGGLLMLDLATGAVQQKFEVGQGPMAIAITPDGQRAIVACFGSGNLSTPDGQLAILDLAQKTVVDRVDAGLYPEELAIDDTGTVGIYGYGSAGSLRTFAVADPRNTLSAEIVLQGDSAGVAFFPGTQVAFAVQAPSVLDALSGGALSSGFTVVDVSSPTAPRVLQDARFPEAPVGYPVAVAHNRGSILEPVTVNGRLQLREYKLVGEQASLVETIDIGEASLLAALGMAYDEDHTAVLAWPSKRALVIVDLQAKTSRTVPWLAGAPGPADIAFR